MAEFSKGIARGAAKRVIGLGELGLNAAKTVSKNPKLDKLKEQLMLANEMAMIESELSNSAGTVGEFFGDPLLYAGGAGYKGALMAGAAAGGSAATGKEDSTLGTNLQNAAVGSAFSLAGQGLARGLGRFAKGASDKITPEMRKTVEYLQSKGIAPRLSQVTDSKLLRNIDAVLPDIPLSGAANSQKAQREAYAKALAGTFGAQDLTPDAINAAGQAINQKYAQALSGKQIPAMGVQAQLLDTANALKAGASRGNRRFIDEQVANIVKGIDNGVLSGENYQAGRQALSQASAEYAPMRELKIALDDAVRASGGDDVVRGLSEADTLYRGKKAAESLVGQVQNSDAAFGGEINPASLYNVVKGRMPTIASGGGGDLGELARAGRMLKQTVPNSGTAQRSMLMGAFANPLSLAGAGAGGAYLGGQDNGTIGAAAATGLLAGRGANTLMTSKIAQKYAMNGLLPKAAQSGLDAIVNSGVAGRISAMDATNQKPVQQTPAYDPEQDPELQDMLKQYDFEGDKELQQMLGGNYYDKLSQAESGGNPNAANPNSSATGLYQFTDGTWKAMVDKHGADLGIGYGDKNDPAAQRVMAELLTNENAQVLENKTGQTPNDADLYLAHFMGSGKAAQAKQAMGQNNIAANMFPREAQANKSIFYDGQRPRTVDEVYQILGRKVQ